jgi:mono/diheme cytochrome c family protein
MAYDAKLRSNMMQISLMIRLGSMSVPSPRSNATWRCISRSYQGGRDRRVRQLLAAVALGVAALPGICAAQEPSQRQQSQQPSPGFDYWQPEWMTRELWGPGRMPKSMMARLLRHSTYVNFGVEKDYEGAKSPVTGKPEAISDGAKLYAQNCAACHGPNGMGNGDSGRALSPSPALLAYMIRRPIAVDEYLLWTISEGGKQFGTDMPAFKDKLARDEIWKIIAYMRAGFAEPGTALDRKQ